MFREGHNVRKTSDGDQKRQWFFQIFFLEFLWKINAKSLQKRAERLPAQKSFKKTRLEPDFSAKSQFLTHFGNPSGSPERSKRDEQHLQKLLPGAIWCNFVALQALLSLLAPFRLPSGTILIQFWLHFAYFQAPFFIPLWHKRDCLPAVQHDCDASAGLENCHASGLKYLLNAAYGNDDTLSISGPAECAKRFE